MAIVAVRMAVIVLAGLITGCAPVPGRTAIAVEATFQPDVSASAAVVTKE